jgi:hypothetical protein
LKDVVVKNDQVEEIGLNMNMNIIFNGIPSALPDMFKKRLQMVDWRKIGRASCRERV